MKSAEKKISVVINTYNASKALQEVLDSLGPFDEVVICDMESTDNTVDIARRNGCKVVTFPKGDIKICEPARNFAIQAASHDWVLVVDADEVVPRALADYLYSKIRQPGFSSALLVPRKNLFLGRPATASPDYQLRFFQKAHVDWPVTIHSRPAVTDPVEEIPARREELYLRHLDDRSIASRIDKINAYTDYEVVKRARKRYGSIAMLWRPFWFFLRTYLFNKGFKDGKRGFVRCYMAAMYQMMTMAKMYENSLKG